MIPLIDSFIFYPIPTVHIKPADRLKNVIKESLSAKNPKNTAIKITLSSVMYLEI